MVGYLPGVSQKKTTERLILASVRKEGREEVMNLAGKIIKCNKLIKRPTRTQQL
jgi:hypothetical protein